MIKACIFDLDGTLADTLESMAYITNIIMEKFGLKTLPVDNFRYYSGEGANMLIRRALKDAVIRNLLTMRKVRDFTGKCLRQIRCIRLFHMRECRRH